MTQTMGGKTILTDTPSFSMANQTPMTVEVAQGFFRKYGDDTQGLYDEIYKNIASKEGAELANDNYLDALQLTALMIRKTKSSFRMLTGCTAEAFIGHLSQYFSEMVERLHASGKVVKLIVLNAENRSTFLDDLARRYQGTFQLEYAAAMRDEMFSHYVVADDMVRIEKPHPRLTPTMAANVIQARVLFNNRGAASIYEAQFDNIFKILRPNPSPALK